MNRYFILCSFLLLTITEASYAQGLEVISVSPMNGSVNVDTNTVITIEFNKYLKKIPDIYYFMEVLSILPISDDVSGWITKISGNKLIWKIKLKPGQSYQIVLLGDKMRGVDGSTLGKNLAVLTTFTTGASFPSSSISGKLIPLLPLTTHQSIAEIHAPGADLPYRIAEVNPDSTFLITHIEPGNYILQGIQYRPGELFPYEGKRAPYADTTKIDGENSISDVTIAFHQFRILTTFPSHRAVNVDTSLSISITFNDGLLYHGLFESLGFSASFFPEPSDRGNEVYSNDRKSVSISIRLAPNTTYRMYISAVSQNFLGLDGPNIIVFSTGAKIPSGSISGMITNTAILEEGAAFAYAINDSGGMSSPFQTVANGSYTIPWLENGSYTVFSIGIQFPYELGSPEALISLKKQAKKLNTIEKNTLLPPISGERYFIAYHGWDGTAHDTPDEVMVSNEDSVRGIDMVLDNKSVMKLLSHIPEDEEVNIPAEKLSVSLTFNLPIGIVYLVVGSDPGIKIPLVDLDIAPRVDSLSYTITNSGRSISLTGLFQDDTYYTVLLKNAFDYWQSINYPGNFIFANPTLFGFSTGSELPSTSVSGTIEMSNPDIEYAAIGLLLYNPSDENSEKAIINNSANKNAYQNLFRDFRRKSRTPSDFSSLLNDGVQAVSEEFLPSWAQFQILGLADMNTGQYSLHVPPGTYWPVAFTEWYTGVNRIEKWNFYDGDDNGSADSIVVQDRDLEGINIDFQIPKRVSLNGIIRDWENESVPAAYIKIYSDEWTGETLSGKDGTYQFFNLPIGEYIMSVSPTLSIGLRDKTLKFEIGENPVELNVTLPLYAGHYGFIYSDSPSYTIIIEQIAPHGISLEQIDEIAVKLASGEIVGRGYYYGDFSFPIIINAYSDDFETPEKDGYAPGDSIFFEVYSAAFDREIPASAAYLEGDGKFGTGTQARLNLTIRVPQAGEQVDYSIRDDNEPIRAVFADKSSMEVQFESGGTTGSTITMKSLGTALPDSIFVKSDIPKAAAFFKIETDLKDAFAARISLGYTETMLTAKGIKESDLVIAFYDTMNGAWTALSTEVDVIKKVAAALSNHFSLWALVDKNDEDLTLIDEYSRFSEIPKEYRLFQNYPNPFNANTKIKYYLTKSAPVSLKIFNIIGQLVRTLEQGYQPAGLQEVTWDSKTNSGVPVASGIYLYRIEAGEFIQTMKMALIR